MRELIFVSMIISMVIVLVVFYIKTANFRYSFIIMLIVGKLWAGLLWVFKADYPVSTLVLYNKVSGSYTVLTIYASHIIFLTFFGTVIITILWPYFEKYLPRPIRAFHVA